MKMLMKICMFFLSTLFFFVGCDADDAKIEYQLHNPSSEDVIVDLEYQNIETKETIIEENVTILSNESWKSPKYHTGASSVYVKITAYKVSGNQNLWFYALVNNDIRDKSWCTLQSLNVSNFWTHINLSSSDFSEVRIQF